MIKALFFDIDGTLVSFNTVMLSPPTTIEAIVRCQSQRHSDFYCYGTSPQLSSTTFSALQDRGYNRRLYNHERRILLS